MNRNYAIAVAVGVSIIVAICFCLCFYFKKKKQDQVASEDVIITAGIVKYSFGELEKATNGFHWRTKLGEGGFGEVYKGVLSNGTEVAIKKLRVGRAGFHDDRRFKAEVEIIAKLHHKHLASLIGYGHSGSQGLLVFEFVPNKTMNYHLHGDGAVMQSNSRLRIATGAAKALAYLHHDCVPGIIHRDIKSANILIDFDFQPKVADFGLAENIVESQDILSSPRARGIQGTHGYIAPEYADLGQPTEKTDTFAFGVLLLELITGHRPIVTPGVTLADLARPKLMQALVDGNFDSIADPRLPPNYNRDDMTRMVSCAAACISLSASSRPKMVQVVQVLEGVIAPQSLYNVSSHYDTALSNLSAVELV